MTRPLKQRRPIATFNYPVKVRVRQPEFKVLESVRHLDVAELARAANAEIELGYVKTDCCRQLVRAIIQKGNVAQIQVEAFSEGDRTPMSPELARLLKVAQRRASARRSGSPRFPMPVAEFFKEAEAFTVKTLFCFELCLFGWCIQCCQRTDIGGDWYCGRLTIDTTTGPYPEPQPD